MCGISGIINHYSFDSNDSSSIKKMNERLRLRGPDAQNIWNSNDKKVYLGHTRLSIIDPNQSSNQPLIDNKNRLVITYNGELYNYKELRKNLVSLGYKFTTKSDTEVILKLYICYGEKMLDLMLGMFAFCIFDQKNNTFFIARDNYGIKPLYYYNDYNKFVFSSQIKSIIQCSSINKEISPVGVCSFFINGSVMEPHTMYKNIYAVNPGSYIIIKNDKIIKNTYYSLAGHIQNVRDSNKSNLHVDNEISTALDMSIKRHLVSDVPVVLYLSSGIDSSAILNSINNVSNKKINTISMGFDVYKNSNLDELNLSHKISNMYNTNSNFIYQDRDDFFRLKNDIILNMDQPSIDGINTYMISNYANKLGYKVAISGIGGDEIFSGYPTFRDVPLMHKIYKNTFISKNIFNIFRNSTSAIFDKLNLRKLSFFYDYSNTFTGAYFLRRALFMSKELYSFLPKKFVDEGLEIFNQSLIDDENILQIKDDITKVTYLEFKYYLKNQLLKDADWAGMANSVEIRVPFIDKEFINDSLKINLSKKLHKNLLIQTVDGPVKGMIENRKKTGFMIPVSDWINSHENTYHAWSKEIMSEYNIF